jgi:hypothetical protein
MLLTNKTELNYGFNRSKYATEHRRNKEDTNWKKIKEYIPGISNS